MDLVIQLDHEEDGRWIADVPQLPGVTVYGTTQGEAEAKAKTLALRVLADQVEHGERNVDDGIQWAVTAPVDLDDLDPETRAIVEERLEDFEAGHAERGTDVRELFARKFRQELRDLMVDISEQRWSAGWYGALEFVLWSDVCRPPSEDWLSEFPVPRLRKLSQLAGGWWAFDDKLADIRFVPIAEWEPMHEAWKAREAERKQP